MNLFRRVVCVILCAFFAFSVSAESGFPAPLSIEPGVAKYTLDPHFDYLEDRNHLLSIKDFVAQDSRRFQWQRAEGTPNFGYTQSAYWFRLSLAMPVGESEPRVIEVAYSLLDSLDVYFVAKGKLIESFQTGDTLAFDVRPLQHRNFVFPVPESNASKMEVYVRIATEGTVELPAYLWTEKVFWEKEQIILIVKGGYYGVIMIMVIYNLFIYMSVREASYFYYVCYALFLVLFQMGIDGIAYQFLWPGNAQWHGASFVVFAAFTLNFLCLFSNSFLKLSGTNSLPSKALILGSIVMIVCAVAALLVPYHIAIQMVVGLSLPISIGCFAIGVYMLIRGATIARYFIVAWSAFLSGIVAISLSKIGLLPINFFTTNALQIGSAMEVVLFSLALADRINSDKKEKLLAKQDAINNLKQFKSLYDNAIEGIFQCTLEGKFISANKSMARFMGYHSPDDFIHSVDSGQHQIFMDMGQYHEFRREVLEKQQVLNYEAQGYRRDGTPFWCSLSAKLAGEDLIEGFVVDVTDRKTSEEQLTFLARHDPLTGLVNRREFEIRLERGLITARRENIQHALLYMDLDQFKLVNDTCGHIAGDELLRQITIQLQEHMRSIDTLARLGGDEFGVLLENCSGEDATNVAHKLRQIIQDFRFAWDNKIFTLGVS
ncbi:MAG: diguanylate cyclase, partial [Pseudomonadales bacterium]|nr:diguanylate cyclase [Pseudomonadales bacterium]